jgi:hypothetical protein
MSAHTCCNACRTGDFSSLPEKDMDGCAYRCGCECEACWLEACLEEVAAREAAAREAKGD